MTFALHAADVLQTYRLASRRFRRQPLALPLFALLLTGSLYLLLRTAESTATGEVDTGLTITPGALLFAAFFLSLGKSAVDSYYRLVRHPPLVFAIAQPLPRVRIVAAKLGTVLSLNLGFVALALGVATVLILGFGMRVPAGGPFVPGLVAASIGGLASGVAFSVAASLGSWRRKAAGLALLSGFPAAAWIALVQTDPGLWTQLVVLAGMAVAGIAAALASSAWLVEAWNAQASTRPGGSHATREFRLPLMTDAEAAVFDKEVKTAWRKRETVLSLVTLAFVAIALVAVFFLIEEMPTGQVARFLLPIMILAGVFAGAAVTVTVRGLSSVGGEHEAIWVLKTSPVRGRAVMMGKAGAYALVLPGIVLAAVPLPLVAGFPLDTVVLLALAALTVGLLMAALGLYEGGRAPSFDRASGGLPDSFTMYMIFIAGMIACTVFVAPVGVLFAFDRPAGLVAGVAAAELSALALYGAVRAAGPRLDRLEL